MKTFKIEHTMNNTRVWIDEHELQCVQSVEFIDSIDSFPLIRVDLASNGKPEFVIDTEQA